jgi:hypothetical protein
VTAERRERDVSGSWRLKLTNRTEALPNGNPSFQLTHQEAWFAPIAQAINDVALEHNLLLEKYYHESPSWDLRFNHPLGGQASLSLSNGGDLAKVGSVWHLDDYDLFTRFLHWRKPRDVARDPASVRRELQVELATVLALPLGQWNQIARGYERIWGQFSKAAFNSMAPKYPDPIP